MLVIGLIGAGRLGSSLALALEHAGHSIGAVHSRSSIAAETLAGRLKGAVRASATEITRGCDLVFLTVPDSAVSEIAGSVSWRAGQNVVHCSGALGLDALDAVVALGARRGCMHPLQSFPERFADPARFRAIACGIEADAGLDAILEDCARALGAQIVRLEGVDRARYHAAAVFASNYLVALHALAAETWCAAGLPRDLARTALAPLTVGSAEQLACFPLEKALTGPLARGDVQTIERHLHALSASPQLRTLYAGLASTLLKLPLAIAPAARARLQTLLESAKEEP